MNDDNVRIVQGLGAPRGSNHGQLEQSKMCLKSGCSHVNAGTRGSLLQATTWQECCIEVYARSTSPDTIKRLEGFAEL
jgi:hypothetical protein